MFGCSIIKLKIKLKKNQKKNQDIFDNIHILKPIFHLKTGLRWVPDANEIYTKNMKCTCPSPAFCVGTQRNLYSTGWRRGLASGKTQILALGNAKIYQHVGISNAKFWCRGHCPTPAPDARYFAFWWNIGFKVHVVSFPKLSSNYFYSSENT